MTCRNAHHMHLHFKGCVLLHNSPTACTPNGTRTQTMLPVIFFSNSKSPPSPPGPRPGASRIGARCKSFVMQGMCFAACMVATCTPNVNGSRTHNTNVNTQLQHMYMQTRSIATLPYDVCQLAIRDALPSSPRPDRKHHTGTSRRTSLFHLHPLDVRWCCLWWRWKRGRSYASSAANWTKTIANHRHAWRTLSPPSRRARS